MYELSDPSRADGEAVLSAVFPGHRGLCNLLASLHGSICKLTLGLTPTHNNQHSGWPLVVCIYVISISHKLVIALEFYRVLVGNWFTLIEGAATR